LGAVIRHGTARSRTATEPVWNVRTADIVQWAAGAVLHDFLALRAAVPGHAVIERAAILGRVFATSGIGGPTGELRADIAAGAEIVATVSAALCVGAAWTIAVTAVLIPIHIRRAEMLFWTFFTALCAVRTHFVAADLVTAA
jgi:hypothetical protein